jgi:hypothetical protein
LIVATAAGLWMAATWLAASRGVLREWERTPPPFFLLVIAVALLSALTAFGPLGARLARFVPLWILIGVQAFRLPLEIVMHRLAERGIMPPQMTYTGRNWDIATGASAILVAALVRAGLASRAVVTIWNALGLLLVLNVVVVGIVSTPRFHAFGPDRENVFVTYPPFVWLPAIMVLAAVAGHLVIFRALRAHTSKQP